jgi:hypothetical protein
LCIKPSPLVKELHVILLSSSPIANKGKKDPAESSTAEKKEVQTRSIIRILAEIHPHRVQPDNEDCGVREHRLFRVPAQKPEGVSKKLVDSVLASPTSARGRHHHLVPSASKRMLQETSRTGLKPRGYPCQWSIPGFGIETINVRTTGITNCAVVVSHVPSRSLPEDERISRYLQISEVSFLWR